MTGSAPNSCRCCGIDERCHARQWTKPVDWHKWEQPTQGQIKSRLLERQRNKECSA